MRLAHRSGATDAEIALALPGDDLVPLAQDVVDRCATLPAPPERVWPWLVQLGKGRAGWYFPRAVERFLPRTGLRRLDPALQHLAVGDEHADWGPGDPVLRVVDVEDGRAIVFLSLREKGNHERWPADGRQERDDVLAFSWALVLRPEGGGTRIHLRLRMKLRPTRLPWGTLGGLFDWATVALLFRGLDERVRGMTPTWSAPVRYAEIDGQQIVFNSHYLTYCDEAATALFAAHGLREFSHGIRLVASQQTWKGSARWGDTVEVDAACTRVGGSSFVLEFDVRARGLSVCTVVTTYVHTGADGRPQPVPDDVRAALTT